MSTDHWTAQWEGYIVPKVSGTHVIRLASNYGAELTLGSSVLIAKLDHAADISESVELNLAAGVPTLKKNLENISGTYISPGSVCVGRNNCVGYVEVVFWCY